MASPNNDSPKDGLDHQTPVVATTPGPAPTPPSDVPPEAVEKSLLDEANKAGVPAFQFDPNARPEDKASAVKSVGYHTHTPSPSFLYWFQGGPFHC